MKRFVLVVALAACGNVSGNSIDAARHIDSPRAIDAPGIDADLRRCDPSKPFDAPVAIDEVNTTSAEGGAELSPDELTMYLYTNRGGAGSSGGDDIFVTARSSITSPFAMPAPLANVNTSGEEEVPSVTGDGLYLYWDHFTPNTTGWDIWVAQRANTMVDFTSPALVASLSSSPTLAEDDNQFVLPNNSAMYFISTRSGNADIYRATRNIGGTFDTPVVVNATPSADEACVVVTSDELTMYFSTDAAPTLGARDIWMTKRSTINDGWGTPSTVAELSTASTDLVTWVSPDGCDIYLQRDVGSRSYDIFWARKPL